MDVDVDELRAERAPERRAQVPELRLERRRLAVRREDHLELLQVEGARVEVARGRVGVVPGAVVVVRRIGDVEHDRSRREVERFD